MSNASRPERVNRGGRPRIYSDDTRPRQFTLYVDRDVADTLEKLLKQHKSSTKLTKFVGEVANGALRDALDRLGDSQSSMTQGAA